jgi:hypothetical protein
MRSITRGSIHHPAFTTQKRKFSATNSPPKIHPPEFTTQNSPSSMILKILQILLPVGAFVREFVVLLTVPPLAFPELCPCLLGALQAFRNWI